MRGKCLNRDYLSSSSFSAFPPTHDGQVSPSGTGLRSQPGRPHASLSPAFPDFSQVHSGTHWARLVFLCFGVALERGARRIPRRKLAHPLLQGQPCFISRSRPARPVHIPHTRIVSVGPCPRTSSPPRHTSLKPSPRHGNTDVLLEPNSLRQQAHVGRLRRTWVWPWFLQMSPELLGHRSRKSSWPAWVRVSE